MIPVYYLTPCLCVQYNHICVWLFYMVAVRNVAFPKI